MIRIGVADDHLLVRKSLAHLISTFGGVEVVLEAEDGRQLLEMMPSAEIDMLLMDLLMPQIDGCRACEIIRQKYPNVKVLMISHLATRDTIQKVMACGAHGFFSKNSNPEQLETAIQSVWSKEYFFDMAMTAVVREALNLQKAASVKNAAQNVISDREIDVIRLAAKELSSFQIADKLNINVRTVETHRKRIMEKTHSKNFIGVILFALQHKLISLEEL